VLLRLRRPGTTAYCLTIAARAHLPRARARVRGIAN
jgi:hypothetical protein